MEQFTFWFGFFCGGALATIMLVGWSALVVASDADDLAAEHARTEAER